MDSAEALHIRGTRTLPTGVILLCRVENGEEWIPSFLHHYRSMGVAHMVFLDTGSMDDTLNLLQGHDITTYTTTLPFKTHRLQMRRWLMDLCPVGTWTLNVDIDELFMFPSPTPSPSPEGGGRRLDRLIAYMNHHGYTAMRAHMLDMFASGPIGSADAGESAPLTDRYPWYDLSDIEQLEEPTYFGLELPAYRGGIRKTIFNREHFWLTKHPLIKTGCNVRAFDESEHAVYNARIADVTGALLHYKFTKGFAAYVEASVERGQHWNESEEYKIYQRALLENPRLTFKGDTAQRWQGVDLLVEQGLLQVSNAYHQFATGSSTVVPGGLSAACA